MIADYYKRRTDADKLETIKIWLEAIIEAADKEMKSASRMASREWLRGRISAAETMLEWMGEK